jgi:hypothetical protein
MRTPLFIASLLILQGCTVTSAIFTSHAAGDFNPLTLPSIDVEKYNKDKQECFKLVQSQIDTQMTSNYNIMKFRECLIQKGYVLLS